MINGKIFIRTLHTVMILALAMILLSLSACSEPEDVPAESFPAVQSTESVSATAVPSVFNIKTFESLRAISGYGHCEKVVIDGDITLEENVVFDHPMDIAVNGSVISDAFSIIMQSFEAAPINIEVSDGCTVSSGAIRINSPYSDVTWKGGCVPSIDFVLENMNLKSFNGTELRERNIGGAGTSVFEEAILKDTSGEPILGVSCSVSGNVITLQYPFALNENVINRSTLQIKAANCVSYRIADCDGKIVENISSGKRFVVVLTDEKGENRGYYLDVKRMCNDLPVMSLYTEGGKSIDSKEVYTKGSLSIDCSGAGEYINFSFKDKPLGVKGRGNASWNSTDKKSYRLKFDEKVSVLGMEPDKDWVLVSNYFDKSLMRNVVAHELAKQMENLEYTPTHILVDLFINGEYRGVYTVADKIEVSKEKVDIETSDNVENPGFLIEIGWDYSAENIYGKDYFDVETIVRLYVKEPEITAKYNSRMLDIIEYVRLADKAILAGNGYEDYIDVDSMVDWFIIAELTNNTEMAFYRSCYFYKPEGGKIKMGPVWDFDMAFGNHRADISSYDGWATAEAEFVYVNDTWTTYLIKDKSFMEKVRARWNEKKDVLLKTADETIEKSLSVVCDSSVENFKKWDILNKQIGEGNVDYRIYDTHEKQVGYVREFIKERAEWITDRLS